jgi:hypothetical protein
MTKFVETADGDLINITEIVWVETRWRAEERHWHRVAYLRDGREFVLSRRATLKDAPVVAAEPGWMLLIPDDGFSTEETPTFKAWPIIAWRCGEDDPEPVTPVPITSEDHGDRAVLAPDGRVLMVNDQSANVQFADVRDWVEHLRVKLEASLAKLEAEEAAEVAKTAAEVIKYRELGAEAHVGTTIAHVLLAGADDIGFIIAEDSHEVKHLRAAFDDYAKRGPWPEVKWPAPRHATPEAREAAIATARTWLRWSRTERPRTTPEPARTSAAQLSRDDLRDAALAEGFIVSHNKNGWFVFIEPELEEQFRRRASQ